MKVFDALVRASIKKEKSANGDTKYVDFVEVGDDLLATVLLCLAEVGTDEHRIKQLSNRIKEIQKLIFQSTWSETSPLKTREKDIKGLLRGHVQSGKLADEVPNELSTLISKYYAYLTGVIAVSIKSIPVLNVLRPV